MDSAEEDDDNIDEENITTPKRNTEINHKSSIVNQGNTPSSSSLRGTPSILNDIRRNSIDGGGFNTPPPPARRSSTTIHPTVHSKSINNNNNNNVVQKPIINPFEAALTERLHLPLINSPNLFRLPSTPPLSSTKFEWTIEEVSSLIPVNVEAHETQFISTIDPEIEAKAQAAIHSYFKDTLEVPSPIFCQLRSQKIILKDDDNDDDDANNLMDRPNMYKKKINDTENISRGTQTELKIPPLLPDVTMKSILKHFNCTTMDNTEIRTPTKQQNVDNVMHHSTAFGFLSPISQLATSSKLKSNQFSILNSIVPPPSSSQQLTILKSQPLHETKEITLPFSSSVIVRSTPEKKRYRLNSIDSPDSHSTNDESMKSISPTNNKNPNNTTPTTMDTSILNSNQFKRTCENLTPVRSSAKREMTRKNLKLSFHETHDDNYDHYQDDSKRPRSSLTVDTIPNIIINTKDEYCQTEITVGTNEWIDDLSELLSEYTRFRKNPNEYNSNSDQSPSQLIDHDARDESLRRKLFDIIYNANCGNANAAAAGGGGGDGGGGFTSPDNNDVTTNIINKTDLSIIEDIKLIGLSPLPASPNMMKDSKKRRYFGTPPNPMNKSLNTSFSPILNEQLMAGESIDNNNDPFKSTTISLYENRSDTTGDDDDDDDDDQDDDGAVIRLSSEAQQRQPQMIKTSTTTTTTANDLIHLNYCENLIDIQMNKSDLNELLSSSPLSPNLMDISRPQLSITSTNPSLNEQKTPTNRRPMNRRNLSNLFTLEQSEMDQL